MLFTPERHEAVTDRPFTEAGAREAIARIAARAEAELDRADGRWPLENPHAGKVHFDMEEGAGHPSRWNTLRALRVLDWYSQASQT